MDGMVVFFFPVLLKVVFLVTPEIRTLEGVRACSIASKLAGLAKTVSKMTVSQ